MQLTTCLNLTGRYLRCTAIFSVENFDLICEATRTDALHHSPRTTPPDAAPMAHT